MSPTGNKKCSYAPMQKKGLISSTPVLKRTLTTVQNEDGTSTNTSVRTNRKGEVKSTRTSIVGTGPYGDKVFLASIKTKPGKKDKTSGNEYGISKIKESLKQDNAVAGT